MSRSGSDHEEFLEATLCHAGMLHALAARLAPHPADASLARRGRQLAGSAREAAPPGLRDDIRAAIAGTAAGRPLPAPAPAARLPPRRQP